jgi:hypothetical protein
LEASGDGARISSGSKLEGAFVVRRRLLGLGLLVVLLPGAFVLRSSLARFHVDSNDAGASPGATAGPADGSRHMDASADAMDDMAGALAAAPGDPSAPADRVLSGSVSLPDGFEVPAGQRWRFDPDQSTTVEVGANVVVRGTLEMRPSSASVVHTLRFAGIREASFVGGGEAPVDSDVGLWVVGAGRLDVAGTRKTPWAWAAGPVQAEARMLVTATPTSGWLPGDDLTVTPTAPPGSPDFGTYGDTQVLAARGASVGLTKPVARDHPEVRGSWTPEVLDLTRNAVIEGTPAGRSHVWIKSRSPQAIRYAELRYMGPRKPDGEGFTESVLGRYALHFHHAGDGSRGSLVEGVVVRDSGSHAFVPHMSNGITLRNNVSHNTYDEAYWWDPDSASDDTVLEGNVASAVHTDPPFRGFRLSGYWMGGGDRNVAHGNVAVGVEGNGNSSGFTWPEDNSPGGVWTFTGNLAHNDAVDGIFTWQNNRNAHVISGFTAYHNGKAGIEHGAYQNSYTYEDSFLFGNGEAGVHLHANSFPEPDQPRVTFRNLTIDGGGITPYAYLLSQPVLDGLPALVVCPHDTAYTKGEFGLDYSGTISDRLRPTC